MTPLSTKKLVEGRVYIDGAWHNGKIYDIGAELGEELSTGVNLGVIPGDYALSYRLGDTTILAYEIVRNNIRYLYMSKFTGFNPLIKRDLLTGVPGTNNAYLVPFGIYNAEKSYGIVWIYQGEAKAILLNFSDMTFGYLTLPGTVTRWMILKNYGLAIVNKTVYKFGAGGGSCTSIGTLPSTESIFVGGANDIAYVFVMSTKHLIKIDAAASVITDYLTVSNTIYLRPI